MINVIDQHLKLKNVITLRYFLLIYQFKMSIKLVRKGLEIGNRECSESLCTNIGFSHIAVQFVI